MYNFSKEIYFVILNRKGRWSMLFEMALESFPHSVILSLKWVALLAMSKESYFNFQGRTRLKDRFKDKLRVSV